MDEPEIVAEFSVENEEQKAWFDGIDRVTILNQDNTIINDHLQFETKTEKSQYGLNGKITIPTGQDNMNGCGIYQMNIHSTVSEETVTVPFELVTNQTYTMKLKTPGAKAGEDVKFTITDENGGYPKVTKKFEVFEGKIQNRKAKSRRKTGGRVDAVSRATSSITIGGGGKPSSGGTQYQGKFVLNYDLITNALLLQELGCGNEASKNVVEQYSHLTEIEYIYKEGAKELYSYSDYVDAFCDARMEGRAALTFAAYVKNAKPSDYEGPSKVQNMLEDGSFGYLTDFKFFKGEQAPEFTGLKALKGDKFVVKAKDAAFVKAIKALYLDGMSAPLRDDPYKKEYELDREKGTITIYRSAFNFYLVPEEHVHTLRIEAGSEYRTIELKLQYVDKIPEEEKKQEVIPSPQPVQISDAKPFYGGGGSTESTPIPSKEENQKEENQIVENTVPLQEKSDIAIKLGKVLVKKAIWGSNKKLFVQWKKVMKDCSGYQIQVATAKSFKPDCVFVKMKTTKTNMSLKMKDAANVVYFRVRAYRKSDKGTVYGKWSKIISIKR